MTHPSDDQPQGEHPHTRGEQSQTPNTEPAEVEHTPRRFAADASSNAEAKSATDSNSATSATPATGTAPDATTEEKPGTLLEQMGGLTGLVSSTLPVLVLVPVNSKFGLMPALLSALAVAAAIFLWRLARKENLQPAISGLLGVVICAAIAWFMGDAKGYFAYGMWYSLVAGIAFIVSILVRWPLVGVIWRGINGEDQRWRTNRHAVRAFSWATAAWAVVFLARFFVKRFFYVKDATDALGYVSIAMGWPLTALVVLITVVAVKKANAAEGIK